MSDNNLVDDHKSEAELAIQYTTLTLNYYNDMAERYWQGTQTHDVTQNISSLINALKGRGPFTILDFGCGPGRDLKSFRELGHKVIGMDGSRELVNMARKYSGCEVWHQNFLNLTLPRANFDGVFANASLFHVPRTALPYVLREIYKTLKKGGALFCSNPRGDNEESIAQGRYGYFCDLQAWRVCVLNAGFIELNHYYRPTGVPRASQPWLATLWRK